LKRLLFDTRLATLVLVVLALPTSVFGFCSAGRTEPRHEFTLLAAYSPDSTVGWGTTEDRKLLQAGLAYSYHCWNLGRTAVRYTGTLLPVAMVFQPSYDATVQLTSTVARVQTIPPHRVYGAAALPLGFTFDVAQPSRVHPFAEAHGGIIATKEPIPIDVPGGTGLNFLLEFGGGVRVHLREGQALRLGYRFAHISNGYTTNVNPGIDNHILYVGWSILR
jgi:hypothetical protein